MGAHIITITSSDRALAISEKIVDDGRERFPNGCDELAPGVPQDFLIHDGQSLRIVKAPPIIPVLEDEVDGEAEQTAEGTGAEVATGETATPAAAEGEKA